METKEEDISIWVLKNIMLFFFLQEFDYYRQSGDQNSQNVMRRFAEEKKLENLPNDFQLMQLDTALGILLPVFAYSVRVKPNVWEEVGFSIAPHYKCVTKNKDGQPCTLDTSHFLNIVRNALAHYADFLSGHDQKTVFFESGVIRFETHKGKNAGEIYFPEVDGYIHFISDFLRATKAVIRRGLSSSEADA
jgi:hypothetical protein